MTGVLARAEVTEHPLVTAEFEAVVAHAGAGAVVAFAGVVRDHDDGRAVRRLTYEAHPTAAAVLSSVAADALADDPRLYAVALGHRVGRLEIGDAALVVAVSCVHRGAAFESCHLLVDQVKQRLPVWKHQLFTDGTDEWVNCP